MMPMALRVGFFIEHKESSINLCSEQTRGNPGAQSNGANEEKGASQQANRLACLQALRLTCFPACRPSGLQACQLDGMPAYKLASILACSLFLHARRAAKGNFPSAVFCYWKLLQES